MDKVISSLGLMKKAGKLVCGTDMVLERIRNLSAVLVLVADDASANTKKRILDKCDFYKISCEEVPYTATELGRAIGKAECACAAIVDSGFVVMYKQAKNKAEVIHNGN